jgi:hypothetical protein
MAARLPRLVRSGDDRERGPASAWSESSVRNRKTDRISNDPYYNLNLTRTFEDYSLRLEAMPKDRSEAKASH